ncbi:MAG: hypothetical protein WA865_07385 [Spirulinaceae cyanobacterium]
MINNKLRLRILFSTTFFFTASLGWNSAVKAQNPVRETVGVAVSSDSLISDQKISKLREKGQAGIEEFMQTYGEELANFSSPALHKVLDKICQQRDCYSSQLYWYTDLESAQAAAQSSGKPILSLRLLGNLDEDLSCANSRFFRLALYANKDIAQFLRDRYILHWESVRPVPTVTVHFGDGRQLKSTLTGNSIHYILNAQGQPLDALPGLYGPQAFLKQLQQAEQISQEYNHQASSQQQIFLRQYWRDRLVTLQNQWSNDLTSLGIETPPLREISEYTEDPNAIDAAPIAMSKMIIETPTLNILFNNQNLAEITDESTWQKIAQLYSQEAKLDENSIKLIKRKSATVDVATATQKFEELMALDTVRNEYMLRTQVYDWLLNDLSINNLTSLNERVYSQLFLTPSSDPWLGLFPDDRVTGIDNNGVVNFK